MLIFSMVMSFTINWKIALIFLAILPILGVALFVIIFKAMPLFNKVFKKYDNLNNSIEENEFSVEKSMETSRLEYKEEKVVYDRDISYPVIYPEGASLIGEDTVTSDNGEEVRTIMKYTGDVGFTIIQEYINEKEITVFQQEVGEITTVLGNVAIIKENGVQMFYQGVEYTVGSNDLAVMQMLEILAGYMVNTSK